MDLDTDVSREGAIALAGALVTGIAAFLPWVTAGMTAGPVEVTASATGIEGLGVLTLLLALVVVGIVFVSATGEPVATAVVGAIVAAIGLWKLVDLGGVASPGIGLYLTVVGGLGILVAGIVEHRERSSGGTI